MNTLLEQIIANFHSQSGIYRQLLERGQEQLDFLSLPGWQQKRDQLYDMARRRSNLMDEMVEILHANRQYQKDLAGQLGIQEFHLSALKPHLPEAAFARIEAIIQDIAALLQQIKAIDEQCASIVKQAEIARPSSADASQRYDTAARAYSKQGHQD